MLFADIYNPGQDLIEVLFPLVRGFCGLPVLMPLDKVALRAPTAIRMVAGSSTHVACRRSWGCFFPCTAVQQGCLPLTPALYKA